VKNFTSFFVKGEQLDIASKGQFFKINQTKHVVLQTNQNFNEVKNSLNFNLRAWDG